MNELATIHRLVEALSCLKHQSRYEILAYCEQPRRFSDIIFHLRLNPASFQFHANILRKHRLLEKPQRGVYVATKLGGLLLVNLVFVSHYVSDGD